MAIKPSKEEVQKLTGWSDKEYYSKYQVFAHKVKTYNEIVKPVKNLKPIDEFFYYVRHEKRRQRQIARGEEPTPFNTLLQTISNLTSTTKHKNGRRLAIESVKNIDLLTFELIGNINEGIYSITGEEYAGGRFSGLINSNTTAREFVEKWLKDRADGKSRTIEELKDGLADIADELLKRKDNIENGLQGSDF